MLTSVDQWLTVTPPCLICTAAKEEVDCQEIVCELIDSVQLKCLIRNQSISIIIMPVQCKKKVLHNLNWINESEFRINTYLKKSNNK